MIFWCTPDATPAIAGNTRGNCKTKTNSESKTNYAGTIYLT
ncbi:hypothetical protein PROSTU_02160 [Providencia stuartii ATCC 25827]|uniref:Uncharacterized protein n=1 Tax=Providencia stuartii ATCC 25827 TaxID=471874 RepID=A0AA86YRQ5_PROST|nr:hypothetical protein PROSTU_02160 [Providencia stuartii ATCC 25827]